MTSPAKSRMLTDHSEIRRWAEERRARPATVRSTHSDDYIGMIRLDFPGNRGDDALEEISWDEWFEDFDDRNLALLVHHPPAGEHRNFHRLVDRESLQAYCAETSSSQRGWTGSRPASSPMPGSQTLNQTPARGRSSRTQSSGWREEKKRAESHRGARRKAA